MRRDMLLEAIDYSKDKEAPITIGTKILKKLDKEWGRDSDIYGEVEEVLIHFGSESPKRLAMALKRILNNYDMWEAPYKGLVTKIEKWQFVNESTIVDINNNKIINESSDKKGRFTKYYRPIDVEKLYNEVRNSSYPSKFDRAVCDAAFWARARSNNYNGYAKKWPAVEYKNGKFYAQTETDGMIEVPFNYKDMTPEYLGIDEGVGTLVGRDALRAGAGIAARKLAKKFRKNEALKESLDNTDPRFVKLVWASRKIAKRHKADINIIYDEWHNDYYWNFAKENYSDHVVAIVRYNNGNVTVEKI